MFKFWNLVLHNSLNLKFIITHLYIASDIFNVAQCISLLINVIPAVIFENLYLFILCSWYPLCLPCKCFRTIFFQGFGLFIFFPIHIFIALFILSYFSSISFTLLVHCLFCFYFFRFLATLFYKPFIHYFVSFTRAVFLS